MLSEPIYFKTQTLNHGVMAKFNKRPEPLLETASLALRDVQSTMAVLDTRNALSMDVPSSALAALVLKYRDYRHTLATKAALGDSLTAKETNLLADLNLLFRRFYASSTLVEPSHEDVLAAAEDFLRGR